TMRCYDVVMRTTINLTEDVLYAARAMARTEQRSLGLVISDLARRGLAPQVSPIGEDRGFPVFQRPPGMPLITDEMVRSAMEDE
ncbi:MAG: hypothetical protein ACREP9_10990, partial [Candidatus Dormibacteraceae bacterium]